MDVLYSIFQIQPKLDLAGFAYSNPAGARAGFGEIKIFSTLQ